MGVLPLIVCILCWEIPLRRNRSALARHQGQPFAEWASHAWAILSAQNQKLLKEGTTLESDAENIAELTRQATEFNHKRLAVLKALQIA